MHRVGELHARVGESSRRLRRRDPERADVKEDEVRLDLFQVDHEGLDKLDRDILLTIVQKFDGGPVGLDTLAVALGEESDTLMDVYEPYLIMRGFLQRTPRGRIVTSSGMRHCGFDVPPAREAGKLFE